MTRPQFIQARDPKYNENVLVNTNFIATIIEMDKEANDGYRWRLVMHDGYHYVYKGDIKKCVELISD